MNFLTSSRILLGLLAVAGTDALVPQTVSVPVYTTTTLDYVNGRQESATPVPTAGASLQASVTFKSTAVIISTLSPTTIFNVTDGPAISGPTSSGAVTSYLTTWSTLTEITTTSNSLSWSTCDVPATCTFANGTTDVNGKIVIPIPVPILVIIQQLAPVARPSLPAVDPRPGDTEIVTVVPSSSTSPTLTSNSLESVSSSFSAPSSSLISKTSSFPSSSSVTTISLSSSSSISMTTTSFSSTTSPTKVSSSSSSASTSTAVPGNYCPTGSALIIDDEEGDNQPEIPGENCQQLSLELDDEEEYDIGEEWHDFGPSSIIAIPTLVSKTSARTTKVPAPPTLTHRTTSKQLIVPTLPTSANRPNPKPSSSVSAPSQPSDIPLPPGYDEYKCENIRAYSSPDAKNDCEKSEICQSWEWWGPWGKDPYAKLPPEVQDPTRNFAANYALNTTWDGYERTCEPVKENPKAYWCKSCRRNPSVCKIIRSWSYKRQDEPGLSPLEACWRDETCESDRDHTRICHLTTPYVDIHYSRAQAFCMECRRNTPVEPEEGGCYRQMDFANDGRQELNSYVKDYSCDKFCITDDYATRYCKSSTKPLMFGALGRLGTQCMSCPL